MFMKKGGTGQQAFRIINKRLNLFEGGGKDESIF